MTASAPLRARRPLSCSRVFGWWRIAELDAFRRTDIARIKQFLSLRADRFRAAYGRHVKELPRCCVFFGTTNVSAYLQDRTGNRRFWPVDVGLGPVTKNVWADLPGEIDQLWAEAVVRWRTGEALFLKGDLEEAAKAKQEEHREVSTREGLITDFLERRCRRTGPAGRWTAAACSGRGPCRVMSSWWTVTGCVPWRSGVRPGRQAAGHEIQRHGGNQQHH